MGEDSSILSHKLRADMTCSQSEEQLQLHKALMRFATVAARAGLTKGLADRLKRIVDPIARRQVDIWLEHYTPIAKDKKCPGAYRVPTPRPPFNSEVANANPFWTISIPQLVNKSKSTQKERSNDATFTARIKNQRDIDRSHLRAALNRFLTHPSYSNKDNLLSLCLEYQKKWLYEGSPDFVHISQGGLPSLGKGAR